MWALRSFPFTTFSPSCHRLVKESELHTSSGWQKQPQTRSQSALASDSGATGHSASELKGATTAVFLWRSTPLGFPQLWEEARLVLSHSPTFLISEDESLPVLHVTVPLTACDGSPGPAWAQGSADNERQHPGSTANIPALGECQRCWCFP